VFIRESKKGIEGDWEIKKMGERIGKRKGPGGGGWLLSLMSAVDNTIHSLPNMMFLHV